MASNGYNAYNYQNYPQSTGQQQQYGGYQASSTNTTAAQRPAQQYQQTNTAATSQAGDYLSGYATQNYGNQNTAATYRNQDSSSWAGAGYGGNRETTRGAAEVLRSLSNTTYPNAPPAPTQTGFTATNAATAAATARYSTASPAQHQPLAQPQQSHSSHSYAQTQPAQQTHTVQAHSHPQSQLRAPQTHQQPQPRPRSVNSSHNQNSAPNRGITSPAMAAGYPSQRAQNLHNQQSQRPQSPAQVQYNTAASVTSVQPAPRTTGTPTQYSDYNQRPIPQVEAPRNIQTSTAPTASSSYSYAGQTATSAPVAPSASSAPAMDQYNQGAVTVDPMAVYNPYTEWEKRQEKLKAEQAEKDRIAEEARKKEEERKKAEEEERARQAALEQQNAASAEPEEETDASGNPLEAEIRAMMAKMRELNSKDPALLARIWEEERRSKAPKSPTTQAKATPQPAGASAATAPPAPSMGQKAPAQRKKPAPKEAPKPVPAKPLPVATPPVPMQAPPKPQAVGTTIWPVQKRTQAAEAIVGYLNPLNPNIPLSMETVLNILDRNPSYIELCEQLENMSLELDRAIFAKSLLAAVPDLNSAPRPQARPQSRPENLNRFSVSHSSAMRNGTPNGAPSPHYAPPTPATVNGSYPPFPESNKLGSDSPAPAVAQMIPIKAELKPPANKEEAARKRTFDDLIDITNMSEDDMEPMPKKQSVGSMHHAYDSPGPTFDDDVEEVPRNNFPVAHTVPHVQPSHQVHVPPPMPPQSFESRQPIVQPLDRKKALRRNAYNIATIARDVLLACGRHPEERQLNGHLDILKSTMPQVTNESDLSTIRWDIIDPGEPPKGYYRDASQTLAEDADDEEDSDEEDEKEKERKERARTSSQAIGGPGSTLAAHALPPPTNPFKANKRGRPPRHSYPDGELGNPKAPATPRPNNSTAANMSASAPRPTAGSVGYSAFRAATEYGPDGKPLPRKRGRPVGWRKAIHGSPAAQSRPSANGHTGPRNFTPTQPSSLRNEDTIMIRSSSPANSNRASRPQSFRCRWQNCQADLHNLDTLKKHVQKVHCKKTLRGTLECLWEGCERKVTSTHPTTGVMTERPEPFNDEADWREHIELRHFGPLAWELGDGPASGLSDAHDTDYSLRDAQGRRVTPLVSADPSRYPAASPAGRGRGRPPKALTPQEARQAAKEKEARQAQTLLVAQKRRLGGAGIDRGGATLVNDKRRRGFSDGEQTEEEFEFVDAED